MDANAPAIARQIHFDEADAERFAAIYEQSFPSWERGDTQELIASIESGERLCYLARANGDVIGLAAALVLDGTPTAFLEYLAVDVEHRSAGVGGRLMSHLRGQLGSDARGVSGVVLEVDPPWAVEGDERVLRERRIGFYLRHGATVVDCAPRYRTPNLEREGETVPFTLLWLPVDPGAPQALAGDRLRDSVHAILTQSYELSPDDPLVRKAVDELAC